MIGLPYADNNWDEIIPGLFMGGHDRKGGDGEYPVEDVVVGDEFDVVISLYHRHGHGPAEGVEHHYLRIPDGSLAVGDRAEVERLADIAARAVKDGRRALIRCQAGYNRSGLVTVLALLRLGFTADDAIDLVREKRSQHALFNEHFLAYLRGAR